MCVFFHLLHTEYQNMHSTSKVTFLGSEDILAGSHKVKSLVEGLRPGFKVEVRVGFRLGSGSGV